MHTMIEGSNHNGDRHVTFSEMTSIFVAPHWLPFFIIIKRRKGMSTSLFLKLKGKDSTDHIRKEKEKNKRK